MLTPLGLVVALVLSAPALWDAANGSLGLAAALLRLAAALVFVAVGTAVLRTILTPGRKAVPIEDSGRSGADGHLARRRDDT